MTKTTNERAATMPLQAEPEFMRKRIGSTTFVVSVRFSTTNRETAQDKLLRLMGMEVSYSA